MRIITGSEMKKLDQWAINEYKVPSLLLMENAGGAIVKKTAQILGGLGGRQVIILAGKGNNGGDALVAARRLHELGAEVRLFLLYSPENYAGDSLENWRLIEKQGMKWHLLSEENSLYLLKFRLNQCELVIDGIFGTGFRGKPPKNIARVIEAVNESKITILSIDIPSGLDADTGKVEGQCIKADYTVTFAWAKRGLVIYPGKEYVGQLEVAPISLPEAAIGEIEHEEYYVEEKLVRKNLPAIDRQGYKNTYGHVLVIAGSAGMTGAAYLASKAALRAGAGMATACLPASLAAVFDIALPEVITKGVEQTEQLSIAATAWPQIKELLNNKKSVVFGPGLTAHPETKELLISLLADVNIPLVIDADGLNVLAQQPDLLEKVQAPVVLTPHPGEMARLLGTTTENIQLNRVEIARRTAVALKAVVVLKGAATITATPQGIVYINSTGCPALATAGTGDVLAGTIGAFLAQGIDPVAAAYTGVYIHGLAGDLAAGEKGMRGVIAGDVLEMLPYAMKTVSSGTLRRASESVKER